MLYSYNMVEKKNTRHQAFKLVTTLSYE